MVIIGSGMLARGFSKWSIAEKKICVYAYGVSDSRCTDQKAFLRESSALKHALISHPNSIFIYFGSCSVDDPEMIGTPYIDHKLRMESLVASHVERSLIIRLPQVAGFTKNKSNLLSFLADHIQHHKSFDLWLNASRNIIDVDDVVSTVKVLIEDKGAINKKYNIASTVSHQVAEIVATMENVLGKKAIFNEKLIGTKIHIDLSRTLKYLEAARIKFDDDYLLKVITKYYSYY